MKHALILLSALPVFAGGCSPTVDPALTGTWEQGNGSLVLGTREDRGVIGQYVPSDDFGASFLGTYCRSPADVLVDRDLLGQYQIMWLADANHPCFDAKQDAIICGGCAVSGDELTCDAPVLRFESSYPGGPSSLPYGYPCHFFRAGAGSGDGGIPNGDGGILPGDGGASVNPVKVASGNPDGIAVDASNVYWTDPTNMWVKQAPLAGGSPTLLAGGMVNPAAIVVDSTSVYYSAAGSSITKVPLGGGNFVTLASGQSDPAGIAVDANDVYWTNLNGGTVMKVPLGGGTLVTLASNQNEPAGIRVDGTSVYWRASTQVWKVPLGGGSPIALVSGTPVTAIDLDATSVYWTNLTGGTVNKVPIGGGAPVTLASGQSGPAGIAVDSSFVYWTNNSGGTVMKIPLGGGSPITFASGQNKPANIRVGPTAVCWTNSDAVMCAAK